MYKATITMCSCTPLPIISPTTRVSPRRMSDHRRRRSSGESLTVCHSVRCRPELRSLNLPIRSCVSDSAALSGATGGDARDAASGASAATPRWIMVTCCEGHRGRFSIGEPGIFKTRFVCFIRPGVYLSRVRNAGRFSSGKPGVFRHFCFFKTHFRWFTA